jgi:hypothetical protein
MKDTGASAKAKDITLASETLPLTFEAAFLAAYPDTGRSSFVSRTIVVIGGPGTLTLKDTEGDSVTFDVVDREVREFQAVGVVSYTGITKICVML